VSTAEPSVYLAFCAIYRDEAPYLAEWVEFHKLVGVERLLLYNNLSTDNHLEVLAPYIEEGSVVVHDWPGDAPDIPAQAKCYTHCAEQYRDDFRWFGFVDLDEFLFSPTGRPIPEVLKEFEYAPCVFINDIEFGSSGHKTKPPGLVIESYTRRTDDPSLNGCMKKILDPKRVIKAGIHTSQYTEGTAVNENHEPVTGRNEGKVTISKLRFNHYYTKSEEEARVKAYRLRPSDAKEHVWLQRDLPGMLAMRDQVTDTEILSYVAALREALERRRSGAGVEAAS
jgi:hypothetical protein